MRMMLYWIASLALAAPLFAQTDAAHPYQFSEQAHAVVERLSSFNAIVAQDWQYHEGPVEHGESPDLDASKWRTVRLDRKSVV